MVDEKPRTWLISVCGLNCAACDIYQAGRGNEKLRDGIVQWFKEKRDTTVNPEQIRCDGCRGSLEAHWSPDCKMQHCATRKGLHYCFQCEEFQCALLDEFSSDGVAHHKRTVENLRKMKEIGIEVWIEDQKRKGQCLFCP